MTKLDITFFSDCLGRDAQVRVLLPSKHNFPAGHRFPTLYLLHGLTDSAQTWLYRTSVERYCDGLNLAVVLPDAERSFYCDMKYGDAYFTHISQEIPNICEQLLPLVPDDSHRYVAGNSMGGYGAYKIALKNPHSFTKVAALSGVMDINAMIRDFPELEKDWLLCFGSNHAPASEDLLELLPKTVQPPKMYLYCGTDDFLAEGNRKFCRLCSAQNLPLTAVWEEKGIHNWNCWDAQLPGLLKWLTE